MHRRLFAILAIFILGAAPWAAGEPVDRPPAAEEDYLDQEIIQPVNNKVADQVAPACDDDQDECVAEDCCECVADDYCECEDIRPGFRLLGRHSCGPPRGFWARAEYLQWWVRGQDLPPLVTTSPDNTPQAQAGVLPDATILFGNGQVDRRGRSGGRFTFGYWLNCEETVGVEWQTLVLENEGTKFNALSPGLPILARPFFNTESSANDSGLIAFPGIVAGSINISTSSQIAGTDVYLRHAVCDNDCYRIDMLGGYRYFHLRETLGIVERTISTDTGGVIPLGTTFDVRDGFLTSNDFHGGELGMSLQVKRERWTFDATSKFALGGLSQRVRINGQTTITVPGVAPFTSTGGFLALDTPPGGNIGTFARSRFSFLPEINLDWHYQLNDLWRFNVGYTYMFVTNVVRPGNQVDTRLDPQRFPPVGTPTTPFPVFAFHPSDLWLQGINLGLECRF